MTLTDQARALTIPHADQPVDTAELRDRLEAVTRLCWKMAETVERLPRTIDGKPILPGDRVWNIAKPGSDEIVEFEVRNFEYWGVDSWGEPNVPRCKRLNDNSGWSATRCYSTREAAEAAKDTDHE